MAVTTGVPHASPRYQNLIKRTVPIYVHTHMCMYIYIYIYAKRVFPRFIYLYIQHNKCYRSIMRASCGASFYYAGKRKENPSHKCRLVENNGYCVIVTNLRVQAWSGAIIFLLRFHQRYQLFYLCAACNVYALNTEQYRYRKEGSVRISAI